MWANICWQLQELWAPPFSCVFINLFLCNLKLRHNSRGWQKSWARVPSVTGLPWPACWLPPTECCLLLPKCTGWYPMLQDSFPDTVLGTALFLNSEQQHTEHRSTSLEMQIQGECAEFATKQRHLAYSHLESLQPRTFNAFWTQFGCLPSELNKYWQEQAQVWNQPQGGSYTTCSSIPSFRALHTWSKIDWKAFPQGLQ